MVVFYGVPSVRNHLGAQAWLVQVAVDTWY